MSLSAELDLLVGAIRAVAVRLDDELAAGQVHRDAPLLLLIAERLALVARVVRGASPLGELRAAHNRVIDDSAPDIQLLSDRLR